MIIWSPPIPMNSDVCSFQTPSGLLEGVVLIQYQHQEPEQRVVNGGKLMRATGYGYMCCKRFRVHYNQNSNFPHGSVAAPMWHLLYRTGEHMMSGGLCRTREHWFSCPGEGTNQPGRSTWIPGTSLSGSVKANQAREWGQDVLGAATPIPDLFLGPICPPTLLHHPPHLLHNLWQLEPSVCGHLNLATHHFCQWSGFTLQHVAFVTARKCITLPLEHEMHVPVTKRLLKIGLLMISHL